ncbi:hypothetical protein HDU98_001734, partial [Podochytrium sp. JEL0797]
MAVAQEKPTAAELYGPMEVEFARIAVKSLPSLKGREALMDEFMDLSVVSLLLFMGTMPDKNWMIKSVLKMINVRHRILDVCNPMDRQKMLELLVLFAERNKQHMLYRNSLIQERFQRANAAAAGFKPAPRRNSETEDMKRRWSRAILSIPSLRSAQAVVNEFGSELELSMTQGAAESAFVNMMRLSEELEAMCTTLKDMTRYATVTESFPGGTPCTVADMGEAFRQRKADHLANLEREVEQLRAMVNNGGSVPYPNDNSQLQSQLAILQNENQMLREKVNSLQDLLNET